jgi:hypothetical protein
MPFAPVSTDDAVRVLAGRADRDQLHVVAGGRALDDLVRAATDLVAIGRAPPTGADWMSPFAAVVSQRPFGPVSTTIALCRPVPGAITCSSASTADVRQREARRVHERTEPRWRMGTSFGSMLA